MEDDLSVRPAELIRSTPNSLSGTGALLERGAQLAEALRATATDASHARQPEVLSAGGRAATCAVNLPDLGSHASDADVLRLFVKAGDIVYAGQPIAEVQTDNVVMEIPCPHAGGQVEEVIVKPGQVVRVGEPIVTLAHDRDVPELEAARPVYWLRKAAESGNADAQVKLGHAYEYGLGVSQEFAQAVHWYRKAAEQRHPVGEFNLGFAYSEGRGVPQDDMKAAELYGKAAQHGEPSAQHNLGLQYLEGKGVPQDDRAAVEWISRAANQGEANAQFGLGVLFNNGRGVPEDNVEAYKWMSLAVERASGASRDRFAESLEQLARSLSDEELAEATKRAEEWQATRILSLASDWKERPSKRTPRP